MVVLVALQPDTRAQVSSVLQLPKTPAAPKEEPKRTAGEWRAEVKQRLQEAEKLLQTAEAEETEPTSTLKRQLEVLARIDLTLAQLVDEQSQAKKTETDRQKLQKEYQQLVEHGLKEGETYSFRQLDDLRDTLKSERRRQKRIGNKEKTAVEALEKAQEDQKEKSSARRLAKEKLEDNHEDQLRQALGEQFAEAVRVSELADVVVQLRKQEADNAKGTTELQKLQVNFLEEKEARLRGVAKFGSEQLSELLVELDRKEDDLKSDIASVEGAATRLKYLDDQWMRAQRQLDQSTGDKQTLREEINAYQLGRQELQQREPLLRLQLGRLNADRRIWQRRQQTFGGRPNRTAIRTWIEESTEALAQLKREERTEIFEIEELRERLKPLETNLKKVEDRSPEAYWIRQQIGSVNGQLESHQSHLDSIQVSQQLHGKLLDELSSDSLAATAKDRISDLWATVESFWNYELTSFGEGEHARGVTVQKVVTALLVLMAGMIFSRALSRALGRQVLRRLDIDASASATIQSLFYYVLLFMFGLFALNVAKVPLTAFTVLGGAVALGIGFGSQNIINNFISGLILLAERPVKVGDLIQLDNLNGAAPLYGNIEHIGARSTRVRTGSNLEIIVPNSSFLQNNVVNFTLSSDKVRTMVEVGVVYGSPTVTVTQLLRRAVIETGRVAKDPPPIILFKSFGDSSLVFEVHFWIRMRTMMDQMQIESAVRFRIDQLFREEGIVIAFPQRDVHLDTSSPLTVQMVNPASDAPSS